MGKWSNLTSIFQMGWNHQPVCLWSVGRKMKLAFDVSQKVEENPPTSNKSWVLGWLEIPWVFFWRDKEACFLRYHFYERFFDGGKLMTWLTLICFKRVVQPALFEKMAIMLINQPPPTYPPLRNKALNCRPYWRESNGVFFQRFVRSYFLALVDQSWSKRKKQIQMTIDYRLDIPKIMINIYISMVIVFSTPNGPKKSCSDVVSPKKKIQVTMQWKVLVSSCVPSCRRISD